MTGNAKSGSQSVRHDYGSQIHQAWFSFFRAPKNRGLRVVETYLQSLRSLLATTTAAGPAGATIECRHFFSGAAAYADGRIFASWTPVGLALKLPEGARTRLISGGATPLRYFPKGPLKKEYVVLPEHLAADQAARAPLIGESIRHVLATPRRRKA